QGNINSLYLQKAWMPPLQFRLHPITTYYFVGLNEGNGLKARFHMASPMYTDKISGASGTPHLTVSEAIYTTEVSSTAVAKSSASDGSRYAGPRLVSVGICDAYNEAVSGVVGWVNDHTEGVFLLGGITRAILPSETHNDLELSTDTSGYPAADINWSGTFFDAELCSGELQYTKYPFVWTTPGPHSGPDWGMAYGELPAGRSVEEFD
ncbi:MAG: hypothetical protein SVU32_02850, partial [Candidatus Nanohaloarchaea archaeon]|nr:hypothetical protein [Candidatus Nanohaloarchaea archaeon]